MTDPTDNTTESAAPPPPVPRLSASAAAWVPAFDPTTAVEPTAQAAREFAEQVARETP